VDRREQGLLAVALDAAAEVLEQRLSPPAIASMVAELKGLPLRAVLDAIECNVRDLQPLSLARVLEHARSGSRVASC
jgi:hypothetical protein